jgi:hypothetical protein
LNKIDFDFFLGMRAKVMMDDDDNDDDIKVVVLVAE